jgi:magnesium chelatase family protein
LGDKKRACLCSSVQIQKYLGKLSGPLLDRIDLQINVQSIEYETITSKEQSPISSEQLYKKVAHAHEVQSQRFGTSTILNNTMTPDLIEKHCVLTDDAQEVMKKAFDKLRLSMRGYHKILKVARTIADLEGSELITTPHIQEAIMYRSLDQHLEQQRT